MQKLLKKTDVDSSELQMLLEARERGEVSFSLIDVREQYEYDEGYLNGVDLLKPTSDFKSWKDELLNDKKDEIIIFTCRTGNRSGQVQNIFLDSGHLRVINHSGGILTYRGKIER